MTTTDLAAIVKRHRPCTCRASQREPHCRVRSWNFGITPPCETCVVLDLLRETAEALKKGTDLIERYLWEGDTNDGGDDELILDARDFCLKPGLARLEAVRTDR